MEQNIVREFGSMAGQILLILALFGFAFIALLVALVKKSRGWVIACLVTGILGIVAAAISVPKIFKKTVALVEEQQKQQVEVSSSDKLVKFMIPGSWSHNGDLNDHATLSYSSSQHQQYFIVIPELRQDLSAGTTLDKYANMIVTPMRTALKNSKQGPTEKLKVQNFDARRIRLEGDVDNAKIIYSFTVIDTPEHFFQVMAWTLPSKEAEAMPVYDQVLKTFQLSAAAPAPTPVDAPAN